MTAIHNIGIVIQQGSTAAEVQQIKHHQTDPSNIAASQQPAKDVKEQTTVQESGNSEKTALNNSSEGEGKGSSGNTGENRREKKPENIAKNPDSAGYIIDTVG
jgi:hypothetical protein